MTRYDAWAAGWALRAPVFLPLAEVSAERTVKADPNPTGWRPRSGFMRVLIALLGAVGIALLVPLYVVALPVVLIWRAILAATVWRRDTTRPADDSRRDIALPFSVWK
jgi:hypothetical protein